MRHFKQMNTLIENLQLIRERSGWSITDLADACGMKREEMSRLLNGRRVPNLETLIDISEALKLGLHELFDPDYKNLVTID